ncbi:hypothetical protein [Flavobacterium sp. GSA192]|uniref:hypothetical protein n=1 Tax=Flavobacterium sp. GSA192 TaxID=2576304 RepID=UPI0015E3EFAB|nr:hypothetical protein [Flavobacterium sp. GSA192]
MGTYNVRLIGGIVIWAVRGFKTSLKDCINDFTNSFIVGLITILVFFYFGIYVYSEINP